VTNSSTTTAATAVTFTDNIPANTTFVPGSIRLNAAIVTDANGFIAGPPARVVVDAGAVPPNNGTTDGQTDVTFQVTINN
jgi:large repetitive protein